jgi:MFS family permease
VPLYPLYALLFAASGLSTAEISGLFALWSVVGLVAEVPTVALADRWSRRGALVVAGLAQAAGYLLWTVWPALPGFAVGFVLWGLGGTLTSGAVEALLYDGLAALDAESHYGRVRGRVTAAGLAAQVPAAALATALFPLGGFRLVGWVSVGTCLLAAAVAARLPEPPRTGTDPADQAAAPDDQAAAPDDQTAGQDTGHDQAAAPDGQTAAPETGRDTNRDAAPDTGHDQAVAGELGYFETVRAGVAEVVRRPAVRRAVLAVAVVTGLDALEEYFGLLAQEWGTPTWLVPAATVAIPLAGAAGAALAGRVRAPALGGLLVVAAGLLAAAGVLARPGGLVLVAAFYAVYRLVLVAADAGLQRRISGAARATVTSVAALGEEVCALLVYLVWTAGGLPVLALLVLVAAALLHRALRRP